MDNQIVQWGRLFINDCADAPFLAISDILY